jgi:hypothetical protein
MQDRKFNRFFTQRGGAGGSACRAAAGANSSQLLMLVVALCGCLVLPLSAQLTRGFISGVNQDVLWAMGDVKITITNKATGAKNVTQTNGGCVPFLAVEPGKYDVS